MIKVSKLILCFIKDRNIKLLNHQCGMTLVEIMVVMVIIGVMAALAVPRWNNQMNRIKNDEATHILMTIYGAQKDYARDNNDTFTSDISDLDITIPTPKNFSEPRLSTGTLISCGGAGGNYIATMDANDGTYALSVLSDGRVVCTPLPDGDVCPDTVCTKMGYGIF